MSYIGFITRLVARPGKRDELIALNREMCAVSQREPGTLVYVMSQNADDPDELWYFDVYADQAAFETHCSGDVYQRMMTSIGDLAGDISATRLTPFAAKQLLEVDG